MTPTPRPQMGLYRHRLDPLSLLFGLVFTGIGLVTVLGSQLATDIDPGLVLAGLATVGGVGLLLTVLIRPREVPRDVPGTPEPPAEPAVRVPTVEEIRAEDAQWLSYASSLTEAEREVLQALQDQEATGDAGDHPDGSAGEGTPDDPTG